MGTDAHSHTHNNNSVWFVSAVFQGSRGVSEGFSVSVLGTNNAAGWWGALPSGPTVRGICRNCTKMHALRIRAWGRLAVHAAGAPGDDARQQSCEPRKPGSDQECRPAGLAVNLWLLGERSYLERPYIDITHPSHTCSLCMQRPAPMHLWSWLAPEAVAAEALVAVTAMRSGCRGVQLPCQLCCHQICRHLATSERGTLRNDII
jgi:hypothetical protein